MHHEESMSAASKHRVYFLLQSVSHRLKKKADKLAFQSGGMTTAQAAVLNIIIQEGSASQARIAKRLSQRESAITTMSARLENAKYITKRRSKDDRRTWVLEPTSKGLTAYKSMKTALGEVNDLLDNSISQKRLDELASCLKDILAALEDPDR
ncbi:MAG: MarR family transcriptional regulator [Hellea sp.]